MEVVSGALTLDTATTVANAGGTVQVDSGATLNLNTASITSGILTNAGTVDTTGTDALHGVTVTNSHLMEVVSGALTLDTATTVANAGGTVQVDSGATLNLNTASITSGILTNAGTVDTTGTDALHGVTVTNSHLMEVVSGALTLDTATTVANAGGTVQVDSGATLNLNTASITSGILTNAGTVDTTGTDALHGVTVTNSHLMEVVSGALTLDTATTVANAGGTVQVDSGATLNLNTASITSGILTNAGTVDTTGTDALHGVTVTNSHLMEVVSGALTLDTATTVANAGGTVQVDSGATLNLNTASITSGILTNAGTVDTTGTDALHGVTVTNSHLMEVVSGALTLDTATTVANPAAPSRSTAAPRSISTPPASPPAS